MDISIAYSTWFIPLLIGIAGGLSYLFYRKDERLKEFSQGLIGLLLVLRFLLIAFLLFLCLDPFIKTLVTEVEKPIVVIGVDNSESMQNWGDSLRQEQWLRRLSQTKSALEEKYEVVTYAFGDNTKETETPTFSDKTTDLSTFSKSLKARYTNRNLNGVITLSDGLVNRGSAPDLAFEQLGVPVFTIGVGDTSATTDLSIARVRNNKLAYLGNDFPVEVTLKGEKTKGQSAEVSIYRNGKKLASKQVSFSTSNELKKVLFTLTAEEEGVQQYLIRCSVLDAEENTSNNSRSVYIEVLNAKQRILILAQAPHPDIGAIKRALEKNINNSISVSLLKLFDKKIQDYNLVILHQLPGTNYPAKELIQELQEKRVNTLFIAGNQSNFNLLSSTTEGVNLKAKPGNMQEVLAHFAEDFSAFQFENSFIDQLASFPPLLAPFGEYEFSKAYQIAFQQKIGPVVTQKPLLAFAETNGRKVGYWLGEGFWRWRFTTYQKNSNHKAFDQAIQKIVQYLVVKEDKSRFRFSVENAVFENEPVNITAELYDETYTLTTASDVEVLLQDDEGNDYSYTMLKGSRTFGLEITGLPPGNYSYTATTSLGGNRFSKNGVFTVKALDLEKSASKANYNQLVTLSQATGGKFYPLDSLSALERYFVTEAKPKAVSYAQTDYFNLINLKWLFFILLVFVSLEWFIRKQNGAY